MSNYSFQADINLFNPDTTQYNGENALFLADCAKLAYHKEERIKQAMQEQLNFTTFRFFSGKSTQAFIAGNDKMIIVTFRGTEGKVQDVLADARLKPEDGNFSLSTGTLFFNSLQLIKNKKKVFRPFRKKESMT
jgi:hypothetical protein